MNCCAGETNARPANRFHLRDNNNFTANIAKTGIGWRSYLLQVHSLQEIAMASLRKYACCAALATASAAACLVSADAAFASQGPGGGLGTASSFTQLAMGILVWGASALLVGTGLIGIARRRAP
jgi:hypothetical protein